jgi:antitoxin ParD1/3/4
MDISITPDLERRIAEKVASGLYASASDVVRDGLLLLFEGDAARQVQRDRVRSDIEVGYRQVLANELIPGEQVHAELTAMIDAMPATRKASDQPSRASLYDRIRARFEPLGGADDLKPPPRLINRDPPPLS